jgi:phage FluMu gp28-like protein
LLPAKITYTRPPLYQYQRDILDSPARYTCCEASTKVGKTASHIVWLFEQALRCKENQSVWWIAPTYGQAKIAYNRMKVQISDKSIFTSNESELKIILVTGAIMQFKTGEKPDNLYGDDVYAVVIDEASRCREEAWFAIRSTVTSTGGKVKFIGNVKGKKNWFYKLCVKAKNGEDSNYAYFKITAYDAADAGMKTKDGRPFIEEIEEAKRDLPESVFRELYLAEPSEDGSNPFGQRYIDQCTYPLSTQPAICYGVDLAKYVDFTAMIGLDQRANVSDFRHFRKDWKQTTTEIIELGRSMPVALDSTGVGDPIGEDVARHMDNIELFTFTQRTKQQLMEGLAVAIQKRLLTFPEGIIKDQLEAFEFIHTRTGVKYSAPEGEHDDAVCALALAWHKWQTASLQGDGPSVW